MTEPLDPDAHPGRLWSQADVECPDDPVARAVRYRELMIEHGHIVERKPGDPRNLPCGWPGLRGDDD